MRELAIIDIELANRLLKCGYELVRIQQSKFRTIFYFIATEELYIEVDKYLAEE